jgi:hypothetical protein
LGFVFILSFKKKGEMQKAGGVKNPPNLEFDSPDQYFSDCVHPNEDGFEVLMKVFFSELKKRNYF